MICINDWVDTLNEDWERQLQMAQQHHGQDNFFTRHRIRRALEGLWRAEAAIGALRSGYIREAENPDNPKSRKFDRIDPQWTETIVEAYRRVATGESTKTVAGYLNEAGLPKTSNSQSANWTSANVISVIRCTSYRGVEHYRQTISKRKYSSGGSVPVRNPNPDDVLVREMAHLRMVDDWLWNLANQQIDSWTSGATKLVGAANPLHGIPRDSRSPLSNIFVCDICGNKMHMCGRNEGGYRCSASKSGDCWNLATALRDLTHERIGAAVSQAIIDACPGVIDVLVGHVEQVVESRSDFSQLQIEFQRRRDSLQRRQQKLLQTIDELSEFPSFINDRVSELAEEERQLDLEEQNLETMNAQSVQLPTRDELHSRLQEFADDMMLLTRDNGPLLQQLLDGPIRAIPCQQFGSNKVVLRARLTLQLVHILPTDVRLLLDGSGQMPDGLVATQRELVLDLFVPSNAPRYAIPALEFYECHPDHRPTLEQVGEHQGISKQSAHMALPMGREMRDAGLTDPFSELHEEPENASRWRPRRSA